MPLMVEGRSAVKRWKRLLPWLHVRRYRPGNPERVSEGTPLGSMPTLSIISSGPSLWLLSYGFCSKVTPGQHFAVPYVVLIIIHTPTIKFIKSHQIHKMRSKKKKKKNIWKGQLWSGPHVQKSASHFP